MQNSKAKSLGPILVSLILSVGISSASPCLAEDNAVSNTNKAKSNGEKVDSAKSKESSQVNDVEQTEEYAKYLEKGNQFLKQANTKEAIKYFELALKGLPANAGLRQRLAKSYFREGDIELAVKEMEIAVKLKPTEPIYQSELAWLYTKVNRLNAAMRHAKIASQLSPNTASPYVILGYCYGTLHKSALALETLNKALKIEPDNISALIYMAEIYSADGKDQKAIEAYERAILKDSNNLNVLLGLGAAYGEAGKLEQEKELYQKAIKLYPEDPEVLGRYGWYLSKSGNIPAAMEYGFKANTVRLSRSYDRFLGMFIAVWAGIFIVFGLIFAAIAMGAKFVPQSGESEIRSFFLVIYKDRPGRLVFTSRRIVFIPELISRSFGATRLGIERDQVSKVSLDKKSGSSIMSIGTIGGTEHTFKIPVVIHDPLASLLEAEGLIESVKQSPEIESNSTKKEELYSAVQDHSQGVNEVEEEHVTAARFDFRPESAALSSDSSKKEDEKEE